MAKKPIFDNEDCSDIPLRIIRVRESVFAQIVDNFDSYVKILADDIRDNGETCGVNFPIEVDPRDRVLFILNSDSVLDRVAASFCEEYDCKNSKVEFLVRARKDPKVIEVAMDINPPLKWYD